MDGAVPNLCERDEALGEQLARTLFEVAGALAQARYVAARVADPQLGRALRGLIASGEEAEGVLRQRIAAAFVAPAPGFSKSPHRAAGRIAAAAAVAASTLAATAAAAAFAWGKLDGRVPSKAAR